MSKAFTRESDSEAQDSVPRRRLAGTGKGLITAAGAQRFRQELAQLIEQRRAAGDSAGAVLQPRIRELQQLLQSSIVASLPVDQETIGFGANVKLRYSNGEEATFQIVGVNESDPEHDRICWQSPLARELTGRRAGEKIRFRAPDGEQDLEILSVSYSPH